jgi:DNA polymerase (family 10)
MDKWHVARLLEEISRYIELSEPNPFRARAFERAARAVEALEDDIGRVASAGALTKTSGIGKATASIIEEILRTGSSQYLDELRAQYPPGIFELLRVPKLGLKKIGVLHAELGIGDLDTLEAAAREGKLAKLKGFGAKTQEQILAGIAFARQRHSRFLLPVGLETAETMRAQLAAIAGIDDAEVGGSVRRRLEVVQNANLVIAAKSAESVLAAIEKRALVDDFTIVDEQTAKGVARGDVTVWFHIAKPEDFGAALLRATGSADFLDAFATHAAKSGYELRAAGLHHNGRHVNAATEEDVFTKCGLTFVEPERREDGSDLARKKRRPLIALSDLRGTFHVHTTFSDGRNTVREMLDAAREREFEYVGISDHSPTAFYAGGLSVERLREQHAELDANRAAVAPMRIFRGTEADILGEGAIDYDDATLAKLDFVIASVHSKFGMPKDEMTERILAALDNPYVTFLGHLTGRLLLSREGYTMDFERVFEKAGERGVMIEINGNPNRLDLDWRHIKRALALGVRFSINPDAHSTREFNALLTGTWVARKGGLSPKEIFNTQPLEAIEEYFAARKAAAAGAKKGAARG